MENLPVRPVAPTVNFEAIPDALVRRAQWVLWRYTWVADKKGGGKWSKVPFSAASHRHAKSNDPSTWVPFEQAQGAYLRGLAGDHAWDGVGFCFAAGDHLTGVDLDHVYDPDTGEIDPRAAEVLTRFAQTYSEISPSGTGFRIYAFGHAKRSGKCVGKEKWAEVYDHRSPRYLTVTGQHWIGGSAEITGQQDVLDWLHETWFVEREPPKAAPVKPKAAALGLGDDAALLDKIRRSKQGPQFDALFGGDVEGHGGDHSAADLALCAVLAWWTGKDLAQMDRIFRLSGLMRDKWDKPHRAADGATYGQMTLERAAEGCVGQYEPWSFSNPNPKKAGPPQGRGDGPPPAAPPDEEYGRAGGPPPPAPPDGEFDEVDRRRTVQVGGDKLVSAMLETEQILFEAAEPPFYERGGILVRMRRIDRPRELQEGAVVRAEGATVIEPVNAGWLRRRMMQSCRYERWDSRNKLFLPVNLPKEYPESYIDGGEWVAPVLRNIVQAPVMRADGTIFNKPGFDPKLGIYMDATIKFELPAKRARGERIVEPAKDPALRAAFELFYDVLDPFSPETPADLAVLVAAILTGLMKTEIGASPGFFITAPVFGTGKGMLADIVSIIVSGRTAPKMVMPQDETELKAGLFSALLGGDRLIVLDEVKHVLKSPTLDAMLTTETFTDRVKGLSKMATVRPSQTLFLAMGNNVKIPADGARRWLRCYLNPNCPDPEKRVFERDALAHAMEHRAELVKAALTVLQSYFHAGKPSQGVSLGSFERWSDTVRSALIWAGYGDPCATQAAWLALDDGKQMLKGLLQEWHRIYGEERKTSGEVCKQMDREGELVCHQDFYGLLTSICGEKKGLNPLRLGKWITTQMGRVESELKFVMDGERAGSKRWKVVRVG